MENFSTLETTYKIYLKYLELKELKKIAKYIVGDNANNKETLSLEEKVLIYKLYSLEKGIKKISFNKFLQSDLHTSLQKFENYFISIGYNTEIKNAIKKIKELHNKKDNPNFDFQEYIKEAFRKDKIEERLSQILWHTVPKKNSIQNILTGNKKENKSLFMKSRETPDEKELKEFLKSSGESLIYTYNIQLTKKFKKMKINILDIEKNHAQLQEKLSKHYDLAILYYFK